MIGESKKVADRYLCHDCDKGTFRVRLEDGDPVWGGIVRCIHCGGPNTTLTSEQGLPIPDDVATQFSKEKKSPGMKPGELNIVAAKSGAGKSRLHEPVSTDTYSEAISLMAKEQQ